jgi:hypothetical protein
LGAKEDAGVRECVTDADSRAALENVWDSEPKVLSLHFNYTVVAIVYHLSYGEFKKNSAQLLFLI